jgi:hypothetical protein
MTSDNTTVIAIDASTGAFSGARAFGGTTTHTAVNGIATFDDLQWPFQETVMFDVTASGLPSIQHQTIAIIQRVYTKMVVTGQSTNLVSTFDITATGDVAPLTAISAGFKYAWGVNFDEATNEIVVSDYGKSELDRFPADATGTITATTSLAGSTTTIAGPSRTFIDYIHDEVLFGEESSGTVLGFAHSATGDTAPTRTLSGATTTLGNTDCAIVNFPTDELYVSGDGAATIFVFDRTATGDTAPKRTITGAATLLGEPFKIITVPEHNELLVFDRGGGLLTFALDATGNVAPLRQITGATSGIGGCAVGGAYDAIADEVFVACEGSPGSVAVFNRTDTGDIAPKRLLKGVTTGYSSEIDDVALMP